MSARSAYRPVPKIDPATGPVGAELAAGVAAVTGINVAIVGDTRQRKQRFSSHLPHGKPFGYSNSNHCAFSIAGTGQRKSNSSDHMPHHGVAFRRSSIHTPPFCAYGSFGCAR